MLDSRDSQGDVDLREPEFPVSRRAIAWWALRSLLAWGSILTALIVVAVVWPSARVWLWVPIGVVGVVVIATVGLQPWWRYRVHRWEVSREATYARTGWLVVEWRVSPTSRIQTVDAVRGPLEQLMGLATLRVTTASSSGAVRIVGLEHTVAQEAATRLARIADVDEGDAT
ncbi:PH domain-containing protein [Serinibacter salmoneus]|uniref:YdbS-like PH domain-containing protein n=1 Tax=Serinibacter salmoneus TaxID=556530 RepID=A0A2A9CWX2_9MICO|nr:PH domain-containing protein [Serinibacter salmoneus]PFG18636.1 hypothetical protein ATL40_0179 [Serinibacter salmoneus]